MASKPLTIGIVMDPIGSIIPYKDSSLAMLLEAFLPIFPPDASGLDNLPVAVLQLTKLTGERMKALGSSSLIEKGERIRLLQKTAGGYQEVAPWLPGQLQDISPPPELDRNEPLPFAVRPASNREGQAYSLAYPVVGPQWWVVVEADYDISRLRLHNQQRATKSIATLLVAVFAIACGAFWALLVSYQERRGARHFAALAEEIEKQRQLLDRINNTISDYIVLQDLKGGYLYVNPAFAAAVGRPAEEMIGLDNQAVFGAETARALRRGAVGAWCEPWALSGPTR